MRIRFKLFWAFLSLAILIGILQFISSIPDGLKTDKITAKAVYDEIKSVPYSFNTFSLFTITIALFLVMYITQLVSSSISKPIIQMKDATTQIGKGDFNKKLKVKSNDEIGELSKSFNSMTSNLKQQQNKILKINEKESEGLKNEVNEKVVDLNKTKTAMLNIMEDMSETNEKLKEIDKTKSEFLNMVSHELKTPLTAMIAHLDVIDDLKKNLTKEELSSFNSIRRNSNQLKILINNILEISRMESGKFELAKIKLDLKKLISEQINELKILSSQKAIELKLDINEIPFVDADESRIKEIINNLMTNAIKFTEKGSITIKAEKKGDYVCVSVIDTGIGIPKDKIQNLFKKFYQVDSSLGRRYGGTGLGLSITKKLVNAHNGVIKVTSEVKKGTTFTFTLPIKGEINSKKENLAPQKDPFAKFDKEIKSFAKTK